MADTETSDSPNLMGKSPKIIIIGAGIAGLAAGEYLAKAGITDFKILEATDRTGGRIWSIDVGRLSLLLGSAVKCSFDCS